MRVGGGLKQDSRLEVLDEAINACRICRECPAGATATPLPHTPRPVVTLSSDARVLIAGQAPGLQVHKTGVPFNDRSGDRLRDWMGVDRDRFYDPQCFAIVPMGFCFPGYNEKGHDLPPRKECAPHWRAQVLEAMPQIELVIAIGLYAQQWHLKQHCANTLTETVHNWRRFFFVNETTPVLPLPHPSWRNSGWLKKNPWFEAEVLPVLRSAVASLT